MDGSSDRSFLHVDNAALIFEPLKFRNLEVKNRLFRSNLSGTFDDHNGHGGNARLNWEEKFARGGVRRFQTVRVFTASTLVIVCVAALPCARSISTSSPQSEPPGVAVYALSRGKGVPTPTRAALGTVRDLLERLRREGKVTRLEEGRIGLEGETRLCADFKDAAAARDAIARIREIARDVDLLNVKEEPCDIRPAGARRGRRGRHTETGPTGGQS